MKITPKKLILDLVLASNDLPLSAKEAVAACGLFDIGETSSRVALTRLLADGLIKSVERGVYQLGPNAIELADEVSARRTIDRTVRAWSGDYITVFTATLGRVDRTALLRRERALKMVGFRELEKGLYIRPDNIDPDLTVVMDQLKYLGVESGAIIARASGFEAAIKSRIQKLWDGDALTRSYRVLSEKLETWMTNADQLPLDKAARESLILGSSAIHQVVFDPLLPEPLVDTKARDNFFKVVRRFDEVGKEIWHQLRQDGFVVVPSTQMKRTHTPTVPIEQFSV